MQKIKNIFNNPYALLMLLILLVSCCILLIPKKNTKAQNGSSLNIQITPGPECFDGKDNDSDGIIDYPADPGCDSLIDNSEEDNSSGDTGGFAIDPNTSVLFVGRAQPYSNIILLKDGQIAGGAYAGPTGRFTINVYSLTPGNYMFQLISEDSNGLRSRIFSFPAAISSGAQTLITSVFMAPIIDVPTTSVTQGNAIAIQGESAPNAQLTLTVHSDPVIINSTTNSQGIYSYSLDTSGLDIGAHTVQAQATANTETSDSSVLLTFNVTAPTPTGSGGGGGGGGGAGGGAPPANQPTPTPTSGNPQTTPTPGKNHLSADLNNDGRVNIVDFSIAAYWYKRALVGTVLADLNKDGKVDLVDFSILASQWTG